MTTAITQVDMNPFVFEVLTTEQIPITVEWVDLIGVGNTVASPTGTIYDDSSGAAIPNAFSSQFGAYQSQAQYIIQGQYLLKGHTYTAILGVTVGTQIFKQRLSIVVPR